MGFYDISFLSQHLGGSKNGAIQETGTNIPKVHTDRDKRKYLPFWGHTGSVNGACCHDNWEDTTLSWEKNFIMTYHMRKFFF